MHVEIELTDQEGENERLSFDIVPEEQADFYSGLLGENTPLARAILGQRAGSQVYYEAAGICRVRILAVRPIQSPASGEAADRRKTAVEQAIKQVERTNALIFATTVEGKWGEYDADGMIENWE
jgi:hypothetical protein